MTTLTRVVAALGLLALPLSPVHAQSAGSTTALSDDLHRQALDYLLGD